MVLVALVAGSIYGWHKTVPIYRAEGLIHVANSLPKVINETDENEGIPMYEEFVESQVLLMSSRHVVLMALDDPKFRAVLGKRPMGVEQFVASLVTDHPPRTQAIDVTFTDRDPEVAAQAVKSVIGAFLDSYGKTDDSEKGRRLQVLNERKESLDQQMSALKRQMAAVPTPDAMSISMIDETMRELLKERGTLQGQIASYHMSYGSARAEVIAAQRQLDSLNAQIDRYRTEFAAMQVAQAATVASQRHMPTLPEYLIYEEKMDGLLGDQAETTRRIDVLNTEASLHTGRFTVSSNGDVPSAPYADHRTRMAGVFGIGAAMFPIGIFLLLGVVDRRFHYSEDALESANIPLLGVLPNLPDHDQSAELARIAAYCVHKLRVRLQMIGRKLDRPVYMITSASAGEGKTSVTLALGMAFATAGKRTLLIDGDPIGRGLSRRLHKDDQLGLLDSFNGAGLSLVQTLAHNVSILPAGIGEERRSEIGFGWEELGWLLNEELQRYDVVLIDTGPILSSLQAPVVSQVADHVIMTVSSGLQESLARQSLRLMRAIDTRVAGLIFNRANAHDYNRWIGGDSYYTQPNSSLPPRYHNGAAPYGPLAASINSTTPDRAGMDS